MDFDFKQYMFEKEQKQAYNIFTREALIDIVVRKNKQIDELQARIKELEDHKPKKFEMTVEDSYRYTLLCARATLFPNKSIEEVREIIENNLRDEKNR